MVLRKQSNILTDCFLCASFVSLVTRWLIKELTFTSGDQTLSQSFISLMLWSVEFIFYWYFYLSIECILYFSDVFLYTACLFVLNCFFWSNYIFTEYIGQACYYMIFLGVYRSVSFLIYVQPFFKLISYLKDGFILTTWTNILWPPNWTSGTH